MDLTTLARDATSSKLVPHSTGLLLLLSSHRLLSDSWVAATHSAEEAVVVSAKVGHLCQLSKKQNGEQSVLCVSIRLRLWLCPLAQPVFELLLTISPGGPGV